LVLLSITDHCY